MLPPCLKTIGLSSVLLVNTALFAHDLYILPSSFHLQPGNKLRVAFHDGDSFPESEVPPPVERFRDAQLRSRAATFPVRDVKVAGDRALGTVNVEGTGSQMLSVHTVPNFIQLAPDQFAAYLKEEGLSKVLEWRALHQETNQPGRERYSKFAKSLLQSGGPDDFFRQPLGFPFGFLIEIIPESNPYLLHKGDALSVQVLFRGKPAADLQLEAAWADGAKKETHAVGRTDS